MNFSFDILFFIQLGFFHCEVGIAVEKSHLTMDEK